MVDLMLLIIFVECILDFLSLIYLFNLLGIMKLDCLMVIYMKQWSCGIFIMLCPFISDVNIIYNIIIFEIKLIKFCYLIIKKISLKINEFCL